MFLVVGSARGEATYWGIVAFLFSFCPTLCWGRCAADTQNHTALQRARNRSIPRQGDNFKFRGVYVRICVYQYMSIR